MLLDDSKVTGDAMPLGGTDSPANADEPSHKIISRMTFHSVVRKSSFHLILIVATWFLCTAGTLIVIAKVLESLVICLCSLSSHCEDSFQFTLLSHHDGRPVLSPGVFAQIRGELQSGYLSPASNVIIAGLAVCTLAMQFCSSMIAYLE